MLTATTTTTTARHHTRHQTNTHANSYNATFRFKPGQSPCGFPLLATNELRAVVDNPGSTPSPEPQRTVATVSFTGCQARSEARFLRIATNASASQAWAVRKAANVTRVRIRPGEWANIGYTVAASRNATRDARYMVSGVLVLSPKGGAASGAPLDVRRATLRLSSGDAAQLTCGAPTPEGARLCPFENVPYSIKSTDPAAGFATADILLADGSVLTAAREDFDFTNLPRRFGDGGLAALTDSFEGADFANLTRAGVQVYWDNTRKPPPESFGVPLALSDEGTWRYVVRVGGAKRCGTHRLNNVAKVTPSGAAQKAVAARSEVIIEIVGCDGGGSGGSSGAAAAAAARPASTPARSSFVRSFFGRRRRRRAV